MDLPQLMDIWLFSVLAYYEPSCYEHRCSSLYSDNFVLFCFDKYPQVEMLGHVVSVWLTLEQVSQVLSEVVVPFTFPLQCPVVIPVHTHPPAFLKLKRILSIC